MEYIAMALHHVLVSRRETILQRWEAQVRGRFAPASIGELELRDALPRFLDEIVARLRGDADLAGGPTAEASSAEHGEQRLRLGFSLDAVVREYGALKTAIVATATAVDEAPSVRELDLVCDRIIDGIARAVSEYARQRDAELSRQANEHFAFVAHELRNPLSSATMAFEQLKHTGSLPETGRSVGALERGLRRASELIDETLQIARIASGVELRREWTNIKALLDDAELGASSMAAGRDIDVRVELEHDARLHVDIRLLRSAIVNLVRNAVKYTRPHTTVIVRGKVAQRRLAIEVEDRCGGLEVAKVDAAFSPFVQLDPRKGGFGLGLAIAKQAVDAHGGCIRVQSLPGTGCIFVLEIPLFESHEEGA